MCRPRGFPRNVKTLGENYVERKTFGRGSAVEQGHLVAGIDLGFAGAGLGQLGLAGFAEFLVLEVGEDFLGAGDDFGGQAREARRTPRRRFTLRDSEN